MSLTPDHATPTHSPPPPNPGVNQGGRRRGRVPTWLIAVALFAVFVVAAAVVSHGGAPATPATPVVTAHTVAYSLTSSGAAATADATYKTPSGIEQQQDVDLPFTNNLPGVSAGTFLAVSGQLKDGGTITCTITVDGVAVATNISSGEFAIASCDATA